MNQDTIICCLGPDHKCHANVNDGYCCAEGVCQYQVILKRWVNPNPLDLDAIMDAIDRRDSGKEGEG